MRCDWAVSNFANSARDEELTKNLINAQIYLPLSLVMSRRRNYCLEFDPNLRIHIALNKSTEAKTGFRSVVPDLPTPGSAPNSASVALRPIHMLKVVTKGDLRAHSLDDIERIIPWNSTQQALEFTDDAGQPRLVLADKAIVEKIYPASDIMTVLGFVPTHSIRPDDFEGHHYFVAPHAEGTGRNKVVTKKTEQGYTLVFHTLANAGRYDRYLLISLISDGIKKFGVIYATPEGILKLSLLYHTNYQRPIEPVNMYPMSATEITAGADKLVSKFSANLAELTLDDTHEQQVREYLRLLQSGVPVTPQSIPRIIPKPPPTDDFMSALGI